MRLRAKGAAIWNYDLSKLCFLIFFLLKPLYILPSGNMQIGDYFLVLSFGFCIYNYRRIIIDIRDKFFLLFLGCVSFINLVYFLRYQDAGFIVSSSYYVFNFMVIICFRQFVKDPIFIQKLRSVCQINLIVQLAIYILGIGGYWAGTYRYMGTYNDPNQLGFAVISTFFILYLLDSKFLIVYFIISVFLIIQTYSTGMLLAITLLMFFYVLSLFRRKRIMIRPAKFVFLLLVFVGVVFYFYTKGFITIDWDKFRVEDKLNKGNTPLESFFRDRNMMIVLDHPAYFLFGFGEGYASRYFGYHGELHSTVISICFYYGIVPFYFWVKWVIDNVKSVPINSLPVVLALLFEAFTLVNHRQPSFWMIIMMSSLHLGKEGSRDEI